MSGHVVRRERVLDLGQDEVWVGAAVVFAVGHPGVVGDANRIARAWGTAKAIKTTSLIHPRGADAGQRGTR
jgi:hypothetical protein